jgi:hypothetical protein
MLLARLCSDMSSCNQQALALSCVVFSEEKNTMSQTDPHYTLTHTNFHISELWHLAYSHLVIWSLFKFKSSPEGSSEVYYHLLQTFPSQGFFLVLTTTGKKKKILVSLARER